MLYSLLLITFFLVLKNIYRGGIGMRHPAISTDKLVKTVVNEYKDSLEIKNKGGKLWFMEILLMKYHQLF